MKHSDGAMLDAQPHLSFTNHFKIFAYVRLLRTVPGPYTTWW